MNWEGLEKHRIDLALPLLLIRGSRGILACGYLNVETFDRTSEAAAIVRGVHSFEDMLTAQVTAVSRAAAEQGITVGMTGAQAIALFR